MLFAHCYFGGAMKTLLQRLSDDNPGISVDPQDGEHKAGMLIDEVLLLLSSKPRCVEAESMPLVNASVVNYGIKDTFSTDISDITRNSIMQERIQLSLLRFEPRLKNTLVYSDNHENHTHCFVIEADTVDGHVFYRVMWDDILSQFSLRE